MDNHFPDPTPPNGKAGSMAALRHKAMALHAEAIGCCNSMQGRERSGTGLLQVNTEARKATHFMSRTRPRCKSEGHEPCAAS